MKSPAPSPTPQGIPAAEWVVAALGMLAAVIVMASLLHRAFQGEISPPEIEVTVLSTQQQRNGYLVEIQVSNRGEAPAAEVVIEAMLRPDSNKPERVEVTVDYVAGGSQRRAGLYFQSDPRKAALDVRAVGYQKP